MKELSIEEKAKAYDEALKVLHKYDGANIMFSQSLKEEMFPELKESEDEQHRKWILEYLYDGLRKSDEQFKGHFKSAIAWLEKQEKQKTVDKVEPKFIMAGDIIINKENGAISKINKILSYDYELISFETGKHHILDKTLINGNSKLWTIQDAKDGDVLVASDGSIFIFKDTIDGACKYYVALTTDKVVKFNEGLEHYWETSKVVHPATKEQRDALMKAMADAGYTFNFDKKELKKIEQKPAESIKEYDFHGVKFIPKFAKGDIIIDKKRGKTSTIKDFSYDTGLYTHTYGQFPITIQDNYEIIEKTTSWSEEDDYNLQCCIDKIQYDIDNGRIGRNRELLTWLKSLKDRVQPQPKHEWSEEDEQMLTEIVKDLQVYKSREISRDAKDAYQNEIDWLKSLRPQSQWKPSDSEIEKASQEWNSKASFSPFYMTKGNGVKRDVTTHGDSFKAGVKWAVEHLNIQPQWKPSDEQIEALANALSLAKNCGEESAFDLRTLYEQLKKLRE